MDRIIEKKRFSLKRILIASFSLMFILAALYGFILGDHSAKLNVELERVTVSTVSKGPFQEFIPVRGNVVPLKTIYLDAVEGGRVEKRFVEEGLTVQKGDPILQLSNPALELNVMSQEALLLEQMNNFQTIRISLDRQGIERQNQLIETEHQLKIAEIDFEQKNGLFGKGLVAKLEYETSSNNLEYWRKRREFMVQTLYQDSLYRSGQIANLESSVQRLQLNLTAVKQNLENLFLRAPASGQLTLLEAEIGEQIPQGKRLGQIDVPEGYKVRAEIDEYYISRVNQGQTATCELTGSQYRLVLNKMYPEVRNGQFEVDLEFVERVPEGIHRGQSLQLKLALGDLSDASLVARGGFYQATGGNWAFVVDPSAKFALRRPIRLGRQNTDFFEVLEGLEPGEKVITSSYENYQNIDKLILEK
ncbi:MAG: HlyD family efflux transporter periplasmic adaptor subunit [Candidatus Glassbacteria bacterium]